jgi:DNA-binding CsgD family transcriptional regulator
MKRSAQPAISVPVLNCSGSRVLGPNADAPLALKVGQSAFGLTPAEAKLATLLYNGGNVRQAAEQLGITEGSARQYIRRIFGKTQSSRQVDMIRMIGRSMRD